MNKTELSGGTDKTEEKNHIDFLKVCRTCLRTTSGSQCLIDESMYEVIQSSTGVMIKKEDELPQQICTVCFRAMQFAYAFRQECQRVDKILNAYIVEQKALSKKVSINKGAEVIRPHKESKESKRRPICRKLFEKFTDVERHIQNKHSVTSTHNRIKRRTCFVRLVRSKNILSRGGPENIPKRAETPSTNVELVRGIVEEPTVSNKETPDLPPDNLESLADSEPLTVQLPGEQSVNQTKIYFFSCILCDWKCKLYRDIIEHYVMNHVRGLPPFKCPLCDDFRTQRNPLRSHLRTHIKQEYKCQFCGTLFKDAPMVRRHLLRHTGETISCFLCPKSFKEIGALRAHIRRKIGKNDLRHKDYLKGFRNLYSRQGNAALLYGPPLVTNELQTNKPFVEVHTLLPTEQAKPHPPQHNEHELLKVHSSIPLEREVHNVDEQCSLPVKCEFLELVDGSLEGEHIPRPQNDVHIAEGVPEVNSSPPAHEFSQVPPTKREFVEDEVVNEEECELLEVFHESHNSSPLARKRAVKDELSHSPRSNPGLSKELLNVATSEKKIGHFFACALCSLKFEMYRDIIDHYIVEHTWGTSPFHCPLCSIKFMWNIALRKHLRSHVPQVYNCHYCGTGYKDAFMLRRHLLCHTGERPYACTYCNKRFKQKYALSTHVQTHAKNRDYKCEECHKDFCTLYRYRKHLERHKDASLHCSRCNKGFMNKFTLRRHKAICTKGSNQS